MDLIIASSRIPTEKNGADFFKLEDLYQMIKNGTIIRYVFHYRNVSLYVPKYFFYPFVVLLFCRLLARRRCLLIGGTGQTKRIGIVKILYEFSVFCFDHIICNRAVKSIEKEVLELETTVKQIPQLDMNNSPLYLYMGLNNFIAGGSVGHIAGVLNGFSKYFTKPPLFVSTWNVPTVLPEIEKHIVSDRAPYMNVRETPLLFYNTIIYPKIKTIVEDNLPTFIYQRKTLNNYTGLKISDEFNIPFVVEYNSSELWTSLNWRNKRLKYFELSQKIEMLNFQKADLIVCVSKPLRDSLLQMGIDKKKILVNPNGVDAAVYRPDIDGRPVRTRYGLKESETVIGFIGTFGPYHGTEVLAQVFASLQKQVPDVKFFLIGDGVRMRQTRKVLENSCCMEKCIFTGLVPQEEGPLYLAACDIVVSPTVPNPDGTPFFGSPTKLFEYMAMGKAIAASDLDQIGEVLQHGKTALLCKPGDAQSLEAALIRLAGDAGLRTRLGAAAREEVVRNYTWKIHTKRIIEALKERFTV